MVTRRVEKGLLTGNRENEEKEKDKKKKEFEKKGPFRKPKKKIKGKDFIRKGPFERPSGVDIDKLFRNK